MKRLPGPTEWVGERFLYTTTVVDKVFFPFISGRDSPSKVARAGSVASSTAPAQFRMSQSARPSTRPSRCLESVLVQI